MLEIGTKNMLPYNEFSYKRPTMTVVSQIRTRKKLSQVALPHIEEELLVLLYDRLFLQQITITSYR